MKKRIFLLSFLFSYIFLSSFEAGATHVMGSDITVQNLGSGKFVIKVTAYRSCKGIPLGFTPITTKSKCGNFTSSGGDGPSGGIDMTPVCKTSCTKCTNPSCSFDFGTERYFFHDTVDISNVNCCEFVVSWEQCCRNSTITTGANDQNFYVESTFNKCKLKGGTPVFEYDPIILTCKNQCVSRFQSAQGQAGDSLVYSLAEPLSGPYAGIPYYSGYSHTAPFRYDGYPDPDGDPSKCKGFHFNSQTGLLQFKPTQEEITVYAVVVQQWQKDSGKWVKVSEVRQDIQTAVVACASNTQQSIGGIDTMSISSMTVPAGKSFCFTVKSTDADSKDTLGMSWNKGIPDASFTISGKKHPQGKFCWTPAKSDGGKVHRFIVRTEELNVCPLPSIVHRGFDIYVLDTLTKAELSRKDSACGIACYSVKTNISGLKYEWRVNGVKQTDSTGTFCYAFPSSGKYKIQARAGKSNLYPMIWDDSVLVKFPVADAGRDTFLCHGDSIRFYATGGTDYLWKTAPGLRDTDIANPWVKPGQSQYYTVSVTDSAGCTSTDSVLIKVNKVNTVITAPTIMCLRDTVTITASGASFFQWIPDATLITSVGSESAAVFPDKSTWYKVFALDSSTGCSRYDSVFIDVDTNCVWPGDADRDFTVTLNDLISIGVAYGSVGSDRANASTHFMPQLSPDWGNSLNGVDYKHIDTDGDGYINDNDTLAISKNLGKSHSKGNILNNNPNGRPLFFEFSKDTFLASDTVHAYLSLGNNSKPADGAYGAVAEHDFGKKWIESGTYRFEVLCDIFCASTGTQLSLSRQDAASSSGEEAIVRLDRKGASGSGKLGEVSFVLRDSMAGYSSSGEWIYLRFSGAKLIDKSGKDIGYNAINDSAIVFKNKKDADAATGINFPNKPANIRIYPNPARDAFYLEAGDLEITSVSLVNLLGEQVYLSKNNPRAGVHKIPTGHLPDAIYIVVVESGAGIYNSKVIIQR